MNPRSLPLAVVHVLDRLPDPPARFTAPDVLDALAEVQRLGVEGSAGLDVAGVLDALTAAEIVAGRSGVYVVRPEARPF